MILMLAFLHYRKTRKSDNNEKLFLPEPENYFEWLTTLLYRIQNQRFSEILYYA